MKGLNFLWILLPLGNSQATVLFSDLGPEPVGAYNCCLGSTLSGSGTLGISFSQAHLFTVSGSGSESVSEVDLALSNFEGLDTYYASIWTDAGGLPGTQVAYFPNVMTSEAVHNCGGP